MATLHLKVLTPTKVAFEKDVVSVTAPTVDGEVTILPRHVTFFSLLKEGIIKIKLASDAEELLAIGGGYIETDGENLHILVARAYGQDEIDEEQTRRAMEEAKKILSQAKDKATIQEAEVMLRRSIINSKLIKRRKHSSM